MLRIQYHRYGGPDTMRLELFEPEAPGPDQVLVDVHATAVNPIDWKLRQGQLKIMTGRAFPRAMGSDFAGRVRAVGEKVTGFAAGDEVFGIARLKQSGAFAEAVVTNASFVAHRPAEVDVVQAASLATPGVMAWRGLVELAHLGAGQRVFVNGCTGGIGEAVTQLALARGAIVIGSCWPNSLARAAELGVEEVIDYTSPQFAVTLAVRAAYDVVFDTVGSLPTGTATRMTKPGGKFLDINATPGKFLHAAITRRHKIFNCVPATGILDEIAKLAVAGQLRATVGEIVPLDRSIALITRFERGDHAAGKGVITTAAAQP